MTAILIINYKTPWHLKKCLESVFKFSTDFHLILVQNSPDSESIAVGNQFKEKYPSKITIISHEKNLGFVGGINSAYSEIMKYERLCLLNSDTVVTENWLAELNKCMNENHNIVQVASDTNTLHLHREKLFMKILKKFPGGSLIDMQNPLKSNDTEKGFKEYKEFYKFPGGYCNLMQTKFFKDRGYIIDPNIIHGYWDEFDVTCFLRQFGVVGWTDKSFVYHFHNVSFNKINLEKKGLKERLMQLNGLYVMNKWRDYVRGELNKMQHDAIIDRYDTHTMRMAIYYFGLLSAKPSFKEYIESVPAREIGGRFLK